MWTVCMCKPQSYVCYKCWHSSLIINFIQICSVTSRKRHVYGHGLYIECSFSVLVEQIGEEELTFIFVLLGHCILWARVTGFRMDQWATIRGWPQVRGHGEHSTRHVYNWTLHNNNKKTLRHSVPTLPNCAVCSAENVHFLQCVRIFACFVVSVSPSICLHVSAPLPLDVFPWNLIWGTDMNTCREIWFKGLIWTPVEKFDIRDWYEHLSRNAKLCYNRTQKHRALYLNI